MSKPNKTGKRALIVIDVQNDYFADGLFRNGKPNGFWKTA